MDLDGQALAGEDIVEVQQLERSSVGSPFELNVLCPDGAGKDRAQVSDATRVMEPPQKSVRGSPSPEGRGATRSITMRLAPSRLVMIGPPVAPARTHLGDAATPIPQSTS